MRIAGVAASFGLAALTVTGFFTPPPHAAASDDDTTVVTNQDYLSPDDGGPDNAASAGGTGEDQCSLPVAQRSGAWTCMSTTPASARAVAQKAQDSLGKVAVPDADIAAIQPADTGYCKHEGCWTRIDAGHAVYSGSGFYGYGSVELGAASLYFKTTASGRQVTTYPFWFNSTRSVKNLVLSSEDLYLSAAKKSGAPQKPRLYTQHLFKAISGGTTANYPKPPSWSNGVAWVTNAAEATWSDTVDKYPGDWYMWAKSIKLQRQSSGAYYVQSSSSLPVSPAAAGYRP